MDIGFVLITTESGAEHRVYSELVVMPEIVDIHPLFGEYDIIAKIEAEDAKEIGYIVVNKVRAVKGIIETKTLTGIQFKRDDNDET